MSVHIGAKKEDIAEFVLMPGDPLRAKYIAENFLENVKLITSVRNMLGYTGFYKNKRITIMASGMGIPSMGIYCYELFNEYNVKKIIRIGTCGAYKENIKLRDIIIVDKAYTNSNFAYNFNNEKIDCIESDNNLTHNLLQFAKNNDININFGNILSSETFYANNELYKEYIKNGNVLGVEMESFALLYIAKVLKREAACILTVSDCIYPNNFGILSSEEREKSLNLMIKIALESII